MRDDALAARVVGLTVDALGPPSLLVNNAGVAQLGALVDVTVEEWWDVLSINLRAPMVWIKAVLPVMRQQGRGRIINVSSPGSTAPLPYISSYAAAKAGCPSSLHASRPSWRPMGSSSSRSGRRR